MKCFVTPDGNPPPVGELTKEWKDIGVGDKINVKMRYYISVIDGKPYVLPETDFLCQKCELPHELETKPDTIVYARMVVQDLRMDAVSAKFDLPKSPVLFILACNIIGRIEKPEAEQPSKNRKNK
jgi:hypothetical protein